MPADSEVQREAMIARQLRARGIHDERLLDAVRRIPREEFVLADWRDQAYRDEPAPIGFGQTISQPYMAAVMVQSLGLTGDETVLDVGSGSGYHAALLGAMAGRVISIERIPQLAELARRNLERAGLAGNVMVVVGDGSQGYLPGAPYDAISVAAGAPDVPAALFEQLADPGRLVIPVGSYEDQELRLIEKHGGAIRSRLVTLCRFVPLLGEQAWRE
jgi:protein-L-isoaspartate(D-aspartate) O-methyltransferase